MSKTGVLWLMAYALYMVVVYITGWLMGKKLGTVLTEMF